MNEDQLNTCIFCHRIVVASETIIEPVMTVNNGIPTRDGWVCRGCVEEMIEETDEAKRAEVM